MARKILVTGAAGLIGREICRQLSKDNDVVAVDNNFRYPSFKPDGNFITSDLITYLTSTTNTFDYVFHMAAINGTKHFYNIPNKVLENNIKIDLAMFDFMKQNKNSKIIYASSSEVIAGADHFPTQEINEICIKNIHNARWSYRLPKIISENYLYNSDLDFLIIRFFNVYGEYSTEGHFVYDIIKKIQSKNYELVGSNETRSFCYVEDAVEALLKLYTKSSRDIFNIGSDEEITIYDAANIICKKLGSSVTWTAIPGLDGSVKRRQPDLKKLRNIIGEFKPRSFDTIINEKF